MNSRLLIFLGILGLFLVGCSSIRISKPSQNEENSIIGSKPYDFIVIHEGCGTPILNSFRAIFDKDTAMERNVSSDFSYKNGKWVLNHYSLPVGWHTLHAYSNVDTSSGWCIKYKSYDDRKFYVGDDPCANIPNESLKIRYRVHGFGMHEETLTQGITVYPGNNPVTISYVLKNHLTEPTKFESVVSFCLEHHTNCVKNSKAVDLPAKGIATVQHQLILPLGSGELSIRPVKTYAGYMCGDDAYVNFYSGNLTVRSQFYCNDQKECCQGLPNGMCAKCESICP